MCTLGRKYLKIKDQIARNSSKSKTNNNQKDESEETLPIHNKIILSIY